MPCCTCTTGSPERSSERSRSMPSTELTDLRSRAARERGAARELRALDSVGAHEKILGTQEKLRRRKQRPGGISPKQLVAALSVVPEFRESGMHLSVHAHGGALRQVIEDRRGLLEKKRQVVLDPGGRDAVAHVLVDAALRRIALEAVAEAAAELVAPGLVHGKLARRKQADLRDLVKRALGVRVERADRFDLGVEEVEPVGERAAHGEKIDEAPAHAVLARRDHLRDVAVACERELRAQGVEIERFSRLQKKAVPGEERRRTQARERGRSGNNGDVEILAHDAVKRREALRHEVVVRREMIVRQGLPVGEEQRLQLRREPRDLVLEPLRFGRLGAEDNGRTRASRETRERQRGARSVKDAARALRCVWKDNCAHRLNDRNSKTRVRRRLGLRDSSSNSGDRYNYILLNLPNFNPIQ